MLEIKWTCKKCRHEQKGYCDAFFELEMQKDNEDCYNEKPYDCDSFLLKCEKCGKEAEFEIYITDLQSLEYKK